MLQLLQFSFMNISISQIIFSLTVSMSDSSRTIINITYLVNYAISYRYHCNNNVKLSHNFKIIKTRTWRNKSAAQGWDIVLQTSYRFYVGSSLNVDICRKPEWKHNIKYKSLERNEVITKTEYLPESKIEQYFIGSLCKVGISPSLK